MADIKKLAVQDRVKANYKQSPNDADSTAARVCVENPVGDPVNVTFAQSPTTTNIFNVSVGIAETSQPLTANVKQLIIRNRDNGKLQISFVASETGTKYLTIPAGSTLTLNDVNFASETLYLKSNKASQNIEVLEII